MKIFHAVDVEVCRAVLVEIEIVEAQDNPEVSVLLAAGVSIPSTRAERLATAVKEAVRANPGQVAAIVAPVVGALATDEKKQACAVITGALTLGSGIDNLSVVRAAGAANRFLAPTIAATAARLFPRFAAAISREAAAGAPNQRGKLHVLRRLWCRINGTFSSPLCDPQPQGWIPAGLARPWDRESIPPITSAVQVGQPRQRAARSLRSFRRVVLRSRLGPRSRTSCSCRPGQHTTVNAQLPLHPLRTSLLKAELV
jgi:hypothetical protein